MDLKPYINRWVILGAVGFAGILILVTLISIGWTAPRFSPNVGLASADLTMIPAPTHTPQFVPTPTLDPFLGTPTLPADTIGIGAYVQINGTEGAGLRIRATASLNGETIFRGEESEVFLVKDGPQEADGYTWWYLVASYDNNRAGWAVADFLAVVPPP
ncbi:MAG: hypothetical protein IT311_10485 [Anaerolineales bacterium]|nr:hypothetical protein [Anaerolineales bacterium]